MSVHDILGGPSPCTFDIVQLLGHPLLAWAHLVFPCCESSVIRLAKLPDFWHMGWLWPALPPPSSSVSKGRHDPGSGAAEHPPPDKHRMADAAQAGPGVGAGAGAVGCDLMAAGNVGYVGLWHTPIDALFAQWR